MSRSYPPVSIFGAPTDIGAGTRGARMGPEALRVAGLVEALAARGIDVVDRGNVDGPRNPWLPPVDGYRHLDEVVAWNRAVMEASKRELEPGRMPIMLGGDHCLGSRFDHRRRRAIAARPASSCACCGWTRTPTSTPTTSRRRATSTACRSPACAASARTR